MYVSPETYRAVLEVIKQHPGRHNFISRADVATKAGCDERMVRAVREKAQQDGVLVGSSHDFGFFMVVDDEDYAVASKELHTKTLTMLSTLNKFKRAYRKQAAAGQQQEMFQ